MVADSRTSTLGPDPEVRNKKDQTTLKRLRRDKLVDRHLTLAHEHDSTEQMLWIPDAVGRAYRQHEVSSNNHYWRYVSSIATVFAV